MSPRVGVKHLQAPVVSRPEPTLIQNDGCSHMIVEDIDRTGFRIHHIMAPLFKNLYMYVCMYTHV